MHEVAITFTAEVVYAGREHNGAMPLSLKVDDGSQFGGKAKVWSTTPADKGDTVQVTCAKMPYGKASTYTDRNGAEKSSVEITYPDADVQVVGGSVAEEAYKPDDGAEIPF
jgi:hypothetical protein